MAETTLNMKLLLRRAEFADSCVLALGEPGYHTGTKEFKIGDGSTTWANLPIANEAHFANYKTIQEAIAAVETGANVFVDTVAQDANGVVTITTKAVDFSAADTRFKKLQTAVEAVATEKNVFIEQIAQNDQGVITITTKAVDFSDYRTSAAQDAIDATFALKTDVATEFAKYTTTAAQQAIDAEQDRRIGVLEAKPFDTYATKTEVQGVADDVAEINQELDTFGDIVTHNAAEFEAAGAASEAEGRINETLKSYYTKTEADVAFTTPAEVIAEVNKALAEVSSTDTIESISTLVNYVNENAADLTGLITEVYGSAEMTGNSRLDTIEVKAAMGITADDIAAWNAEKGVKAVVDANKATWDKAGTALQAADLADYAKTADVVTNDEFTEFEAANTEAIGKKLDKTAFDAFNNGTSKTVAAIEADIVAKAGAAESAAKGHADSLNTAMDARVVKLENNDAGYATTGQVATAKQEAIDAAKEYANGLEHKNTTYTVAATANALEFTVTPSEGAAQTVTLVAPTVDTGVMEVAAGEDIVVTPGENGKVTVAHAAFTTGEYTKDPASLTKTGDAYLMTGVTVDNGHVTGASVKGLASILEAMTFIFDGGTSAN